MLIFLPENLDLNQVKKCPVPEKKGPDPNRSRYATMLSAMQIRIPDLGLHI